MARFVFASVPAYGHFNPTLPIIAEMVRRGHQVTVMNTAEFEPPVAALGAEFMALPGDFSARKLSEYLVNGNLGRAVVFAREAALELVPWCNRVLPELRPDVLVYDTQAMFAHISAKMLGLKSASIFPYPVIEATRQLSGWRIALRSARQNGPFLFKMIATRIALSRRFGATNFPHTRPRFQSRGDITLVLSIPQMQRADAWRDDKMIFVGPCIDETAGAPDFDFGQLDGRPLLYISLGTLATGNLQFFRNCMSAFADADLQVVMSIGSRLSGTEIGEVPSNFVLGSYLPQLELLKRASVFVTHCGSNSMHEGLWYGVPLVGIPQQLEQLMNARAAAAHGACLPIEDNFFGRPVAATRLRAAVEQILAEPGWRQAAAEVQTLLRASGGFRQAADELEKLAAATARPPAAPSA